MNIYLVRTALSSIPRKYFCFKKLLLHPFSSQILSVMYMFTLQKLKAGSTINAINISLPCSFNLSEVVNSFSLVLVKNR